MQARPKGWQGYTAEELQSLPPSHPSYGDALRILARMGALEVTQSPERKARLEQEIRAMQVKVYWPRPGDTITYEDRRSGVRYHDVVREVRADGWLSCDQGAFHPDIWLLIEVQRGKDRVYQW